MSSIPLLSVQNLRVSFDTDYGNMLAVDDVSFDLNQGEVMGIVGESGCGKSVTALSIIKLVPSPPSFIEGGRILFDGQDLVSMSEKKIRSFRGNDISVIFQDSMTALNPIYQVGSQIVESLLLHQTLNRKQAREKAVELLAMMGISSPRQFSRSYPHQLSGGMRQRVMIAMALACNPRILIADEPTTALDVTVQAQIFELLRKLQEELHMAIILITHNLGVIAESVERVMVMYAGRTVEYAMVEELYNTPRHPYTEGLLKSIPNIDDDVDRLQAIPGVVPNAYKMPPGCPFQPRCSYAIDRCLSARPSLREVCPGHGTACIRDLTFSMGSSNHEPGSNISYSGRTTGQALSNHPGNPEAAYRGSCPRR